MDGKSQGHDWGFYKAKTFFDKMKRDQHFDILLSYGKGDGNLLDSDNIDYFINHDCGGHKQDLVTADGGIEVSGEYFNIQELCC